MNSRTSTKRANASGNDAVVADKRRLIPRGTKKATDDIRDRPPVAAAAAADDSDAPFNPRLRDIEIAPTGPVLAPEPAFESLAAASLSSGGGGGGGEPARPLANDVYGARDPFAELDGRTVPTGPRFGAPQQPGANLWSRDATSSGEEAAGRDPRQALTRPGAAQLIDTEELVRRQLVLLAPDAAQGGRMLADEVARRKYVVRGLSQTAPNDEYRRLLERRASLEAQKNFVERQRIEFDRLFINYGEPHQHIAGERAADLDEQRLRFIDAFQPPQAISLLKPGREVDHLNRVWRERLGRVVDETAQRYAVPNAAADGGTRYYSAPLLAVHVTPVVSRRLAELARTQFDDMPLPLELVKAYFDRYMSAAYARLLEPEQPQLLADEDVEHPASEADDASSLGRAFSVPSRQEEAVMLAYYSAVLASHASRLYRAWFRAWRDLQPAPAALQRAALEKLAAFNERLLRAADARDSATGALFFHAYQPLPWLDYERRYTELLLAEVAEHRATSLPSAEQLRAAFDRYLNSLTGEPFPRVVLLNATLDIFDLLADSANAARADAAPGDQARLDEIDARVASATAALREVWPAGERWAHGPADRTRADTGVPGVVDPWSPLDLSYPLARRETREQLPDIRRAIAADWALFDADAQADAATERRRTFGALYANKVLVRELSQIEYLLRNVLVETVERPLDQTRVVYDTSDLELAVRVELSPELAARIIYVPPADRARVGVDQEAADALATLETRRFAVKWFRRSPHELGANESIVATDYLTPSKQVATLPLFGRRALRGEPERVLALSGTYRAEVQELDANEQPVGAPIPSLFAATIRVVAQCVRDGALYTPVLGSNGHAAHGECQWRPPPADETFVRELTALRILVTHGVTEYQRYLAAQSVDVYAAGKLGDAYEQAPWGSSAPIHLEELAQLDDNALHALFSFEAIVARFVERLELRVRNSPNVALRPTFTGLRFLGALAQNTERSGPLMPGVAPVGGFDAERLDHANAGDAVRGVWRRQAERATVRLGSVDPLPIARFGGTLGSIPLGGLIKALLQPQIATWATPREKRFFHKAAADYDAFQGLYRRTIAAREQIPISAHTANYSEPLAARFHALLDDELNDMGIDQVRGAVKVNRIDLPTGLFFDADSETELRHMLRGLRAVDLRRDLPSLADTQQGLWIGVHTFASAQPSFARVGARATTPPNQTPDALTLLRRASTPQLRGYDYEGLHQLLVRAIGDYNEAMVTPGVTVASQRTAYDEACVAVTVVNYFCFLAPPLPAGAFMKARDTLARVNSGHFRDVYFPPTPPTPLY